MKLEGNVRKAAVAGQFYPGDRKTLESAVEGFLEKSEVFQLGTRIIALVAPHAGYMYSGRVAAQAYRQVAGRDINVVAVIAPTHTESFSGSAVYGGGGYETPLGGIPVHRACVEKLASYPTLTISDHGHRSTLSFRQEHSLEVQLPFLQSVLTEFSLIPIVMGDQDRTSCEHLGRALAEVLKEEKALIVASSDLSHFHPYEEAVRLDRMVMEAVSEFDDRRLSDSLSSRVCEACGGGPIVSAMIAARTLGADRAEVLAYANSGDVTGDRTQVVGYMSAAFFKGNGEN
ncbi:MAG: AmmeMemoRadiSam system protein B [Candidatus Latescibacteria bacterium 4484_107]|nr:MAG: AmmeMemoRadiSam system protein B [Candidatus Latescibacteria bacterium 4484_107]